MGRGQTRHRFKLLSDPVYTKVKIHIKLTPCVCLKSKRVNNSNNSSLNNVLGILKNSVFWEDKECHFPQIIPLLASGFEKPFSNSFLNLMSSALLYAILYFLQNDLMRAYCALGPALRALCMLTQLIFSTPGRMLFIPILDGTQNEKVCARLNSLLVSFLWGLHITTA